MFSLESDVTTCFRILELSWKRYSRVPGQRYIELQHTGVTEQTSPTQCFLQISHGTRWFSFGRSNASFASLWNSSRLCQLEVFEDGGFKFVALSFTFLIIAIYFYVSINADIIDRLIQFMIYRKRDSQQLYIYNFFQRYSYTSNNGLSPIRPILPVKAHSIRYLCKLGISNKYWI